MITQRKSYLFLIFFLILLSLFMLSMIEGRLQRKQAEKKISQTADLVKKLDLTDLALFTEARYTRHPSQADYHSAFQDHPLALEHFPTGSLIRPPLHLSCPGYER